jgi:hypothetical protein
LSSSPASGRSCRTPGTSSSATSATSGLTSSASRRAAARSSCPTPCTTSASCSALYRPIDRAQERSREQQQINASSSQLLITLSFIIVTDSVYQIKQPHNYTARMNILRCNVCFIALALYMVYNPNGVIIVHAQYHLSCLTTKVYKLLDLCV